MALKFFIVSVLLIGTAVCQTDESLSGAMDSLPPELQGKVDKGQVEELKNKTTRVFKEKCEKNGGPDAFSNVENAAKDFMTCINGLVDRAVLEKEIEDAKPEGKVDEVFKKYCDKTPSFEGCFKNVTEAAKPCFTADEGKHLKTVYNITEQLAQFVCFKGGDRIALFIAEGGPDCFKSKQEDIQNCFNETMGSDVKFDPNELSVDSIPTIAFDEKECKQLSQLQKCVVATLETCEQPTSANIVESLFKFARKATPCVKFPEHGEKNKNGRRGDPSEQKPGSASGLSIATATILASVIAAYLM